MSQPSQSSPPPQRTLISLKTALLKASGTFVDVVGVVVDFLPPTTTRNADYMMTFTVRDQSLPSDSLGVKARLFCSSESQLPAITSPGDILLLHNMKTSMFRGEALLVNDKATFACVLARRPPSANIGLPPIHYPPSAKFPIAPEHGKVMARLRTWWSKEGPSDGAAVGSEQVTQVVAASVYKPRDRFKLVKDMMAPRALRNGRPIGNYFDMVGKVVKTFNGSYAFELYITDYTENEYLYNYERDPDDDGQRLAKWRGPWGRYTLQISLWDINKNMAPDLIREGGYLFVRNLCLKFDVPMKRFEASLNQDMQYPDRPDFVVITNMDDPRVRAIQQREKEYLRRHDIEEERRAESTQREAAEKRKVEEEATQKELERLKEHQRAKGDNENVQIVRSEWPVTLIGDILEMDLGDRFYMNLKYHIVCKVIEFKPDNLADFTKFEVPEGFSKKRWRWRFALLVEGRDGNVMRLIVMDEDAEYLLKMEPTNLRTYPEKLDELRERLTYLWGNLEKRQAGELIEPAPAVPPAAPTPDIEEEEEQQQNRKKRKRSKKKKKAAAIVESNKRTKTEHDSAEPQMPQLRPEDEEAKFFDACAKEYGHEAADGTKHRMWRIFETAIRTERDSE